MWAWALDSLPPGPPPLSRPALWGLRQLPVRLQADELSPSGFALCV